MRTPKADRRSRRSRRLIVDALLALMLEKRFDRITVQEIIARADVGRTTFYGQFENKEDVLHSEFERVFGYLQQEHLAAAGEPIDRLLPSLELFRHVQEMQPVHAALARGQALTPHYQAVQRVMCNAIAHQLAEDTRDLAVPPELITEYLAGAFLTLIRWQLTSGNQRTPEEMNAIFQTLVVPGLMATGKTNRSGQTPVQALAESG